MRPVRSIRARAGVPKRGMRLADVGELSLLDFLRRRFSQEHRFLVVGIGDDAAVIRPGGKNLLLTTDMMVEGVHFDLRWITPFQLGFKIVSVNVSDIYAMGGRPSFLLLNFAAGGRTAERFWMRFFDGLQAAAGRYGACLIGGDLSSSDRLTVAMTAVGTAGRVATRGGARPGDRIYVTGALGDAAGGLEILRRMKRPVAIEEGKRAVSPLPWKAVEPLIRRHVMPEARDPRDVVPPGRISAMIDLSDGLLLDLSRLCRESRVGARISVSEIPVSEGLTCLSEALGIPFLDLALGGGEDYELLFTAPAGVTVKAACIGEITRSGIVLVDREGRTIRPKIKGYQHFAVQG